MFPFVLLNTFKLLSYACIHQLVVSNISYHANHHHYNHHDNVKINIFSVVSV